MPPHHQNGDLMRRLERESAERMRRLEKEFADKERFLDDKYSAESKAHRGDVILVAYSFRDSDSLDHRCDGALERPS